MNITALRQADPAFVVGEKISCMKTKILLVLKLTTFLFLLSCLQANAGGLMPYAGAGEETSSDNSASTSPGKLTAEKQFDRVITGAVTDQEGNPLEGVSVTVKGTSTGTTTDANGGYSLTVKDDAKVLTFSFVGYSPVESQIGSGDVINISLSRETSDLDEVVVVGYGTQRKSDLTGSVSQIDNKRLLENPASNVGLALEGKLAGVQVTRLGAGVPGGHTVVRIRGVNSINTSSDPLFVVDGIVGVANALDNLNPEDIVSMNVLKDASATAIYGARGANGVIIITTRRGTAGKTQVTYTGYGQVNTLQRHLYSMDSEQLMYVYEQAMANASKYGVPQPSKDFRGGMGNPVSYSEMPWLFEQVSKGGYPVELMGNDGNYYKPRFNSIWEDTIFRPRFGHNHYVDVSGGNENARFSLSLGYTDNQGLMKDSYFKRYSGRITGDAKITKWLDLSTNLSFIRSKTSDDGGITRSTAEVWSIVPAKYPDDPLYGIYAGRWGTNGDFNVGEQWYNILFRREETGGFTRLNQVTGSFILTAQITKDLSLKSDFSVDYNSTKYNYYDGKYYGRDGSATINTANTFYWQNQDYFNYHKEIGADHTIDGMVGISWSRYAWENMNASNSVFSSNFYQWHNLGVGAATRPVPSSSDGENSLNSYFARLNYGYKGKYLLTATGRYDGSSKFGSNSKYGFFPSAGLAWNVTKENFMQNVKFLTNLKIRASIGKTGNQEIGSYVTQAYVGSSTVVLGSGSYTGLFPNSVGNNDLRWEATTQKDIGLEFGILNRVNIEVDYYHKLTRDMLLDVPIPYSTSTGTVKQNFGEVRNKGWEFTINSTNISLSDFRWNTILTGSFNQNRIMKLGPTNADIMVETGAGNATGIYRVGESIGSFFGLVRLGTYSTEEAALAARYGMLPGDLKFEDRDNDGKINFISDGKVIGHAFPNVVMGFSNAFVYKNFDANIDIQIVQGVSKAFIHESAEDRQLVSGGLNSTLTAWRPDHQNSMVAQVRPGNGGAYYQSFADTHMLTDGSFIRGAGATLGYTFPNSRRYGLSRLRVYLSAENFFLITKAAGYDPEGSSLDKTNANMPGSDKYQYPTPSVYSLGVNVSF